MMDKVGILNLKFNYTSRLNWANFLSFAEKREIQDVFEKQQKLAQFRRLV